MFHSDAVYTKIWKALDQHACFIERDKRATMQKKLHG